jgi:hypothetical protein
MESNNLPTHRMVNGVSVALTEAEVAEQLLQWQQGLAIVEQRMIEEENQRQLELQRLAALDAFIASQNNT